MSAPNLWEQVSEFLESWVDGRADVSQDDFEDWLNFTRICAWDIPSALGSICDHEPFASNFPMHWNEDAEDILSKHFKEVHNLEFTDGINWDFDT